VLECLLFDSVLKVERTRLQLSGSLSARGTIQISLPKQTKPGLRRLYANLLFAANVDECAVIRRESETLAAKGEQ
jgi:hypothetical protein